jgi:hypothetical protein
MPKLYQHQLRNNLIALNEEVNPEQIDTVIKMITNCIKLNKKYFPEDHLKIFDEIVKEEPDFENIFSVSLNSKEVQDKRDGDPLLIFLPAALYDICTDHKRDFMGQAHQKLVKIIRDSEERPETNPEMDELYSNIRDYDEDCINSEFNSKKTHSHHTLNTGNWLIEFLKSHIELEKEAQEAAANETKQQSSSWTDRATRAIPVSEIISEVSKKKSVSFAASVTKGGSEDGKGPGFI